MKILFLGTPNGGCILNYLLKKARVIRHSKKERNFHIFYQIINGADESLLNEIFLEKDIFKYNYLVNNQNLEIETQVQENMLKEDVENYNEIQNAFNTCDFKQEEKMVSFNL